MTSEDGVADSWGAVLDERRVERFVGRTAEIELFTAALESSESRFAVLHVHGPGGIGKSSLLDVFAAVAGRAGCSVIRIDGRVVVPSPDGLSDALGGWVAPQGGSGGGRCDDVDEKRLVILIDSYERLVNADDWVRTVLVPSLPASSLVVLAGRDRPLEAWRRDPGWDELLRVLSIRPLDREDCNRYAELRGVDSATTDQLVRVSHGHPLALSLLCDVVAHGGELGDDVLRPDLVGTLVGRFVDVTRVPSARRAMEVCAISRTTTESLLRRCRDIDDPYETFVWLRDLSFVDVAVDGLVPHELARDVLDRDLRWRDPDSYRSTFRIVRDHVCERLMTARGTDQLRAIFDLKFLFRSMPGLLSPVDWEEWGRHYPEPAGVSDRESVLGLIGEREGARSAVIAARWWASQPDGFFLVRDDEGRVRGVIVLLDLTSAGEEEVAADPGTAVAWAHAQRKASPRPGETVTMTRFIQDRVAGQGPSPTLNAVPIITLQRYLQMPHLALDYLALFEPEPWDDYFRTADLPRVEGGDFTVDERRFGLFCHDFRRLPVDQLILLWTERALAQDPMLHTDASAQSLVVLGETEFRDAAKAALKSLHAPEQLAANPLTKTRLVTLGVAAADSEPADVLRDLVFDAVDSLRSDPRNEHRLRAVERTYVQAAPTQEAAAEILGLPFSTYRRHLTQGVELVAARLWELELSGAVNRLPDK